MRLLFDVEYDCARGCALAFAVDVSWHLLLHCVCIVVFGCVVVVLHVMVRLMLVLLVVVIVNVCLMLMMLVMLLVLLCLVLCVLCV